MVASILLLDDDSDLLASMTDLLQVLFETRVVAVRSVDELRARSHAVLACDLAILDIHLGAEVPSGLDAFAWLRQANFSGRVVFMTGHARNHPLVAQARALGAAQVVEKPVTSNELSLILEPQGQWVHS